MVVISSPLLLLATLPPWLKYSQTYRSSTQRKKISHHNTNMSALLLILFPARLLPWYQITLSYRLILFSYFVSDSLNKLHFQNSSGIIYFPHLMTTCYFSATKGNSLFLSLDFWLMWSRSAWRLITTTTFWLTHALNTLFCDCVIACIHFSWGWLGNIFVCVL